MSTWDRFRKALRREQRDVEDALDEMKGRANDALDHKERALDATPSERLAMQQARAKEADDDLEAIKRKIERGRG